MMTRGKKNLEARTILKSLDSRINSLYSQGLSCAAISEIFNLEGIKLAKSSLSQYLSEQGVLRTCKEASVVRKINVKTCVECLVEFAAKAGNQQCCNICIPNRLAITRYCKFKITQPQVNAFLLQQENACAICQTKLETLNPKHIHIDHCHKTNKIRGVLCTHCNSGLAMFKDNTEFCLRAIDYIRKNS